MSEQEIMISLQRTLTDVKDLIDDLRGHYSVSSERDGWFRVLKASAEVGVKEIEKYLDEDRA